jgi:TRAP-type mannitol/chloroaromatic compound transport system permease large subunit
MSGSEVGLLSIALILVLIYSGLYIPVALGLVSFLGVWILRGNIHIPINLLALAAADSISTPTFAVVPLFALMGLLVSQAGLGKDIYEVANFVFRKIRGGLGIATALLSLPPLSSQRCPSRRCGISDTGPGSRSAWWPGAPCSGC